VSFNPLPWVRETLSPQVKEEQSAEEVKAAKEEAKKAGTANLFETVAPIKPAAPSSKAVQKATGLTKAKPDSVRCFLFRPLQLT
jgi:large subunit ribosomal protein L22